MKRPFLPVGMLLIGWLMFGASAGLFAASWLLAPSQDELRADIAETEQWFHIRQNYTIQVGGGRAEGRDFLRQAIELTPHRQRSRLRELSLYALLLGTAVTLLGQCWLALTGLLGRSSEQPPAADTGDAKAPRFVTDRAATPRAGARPVFAASANRPRAEERAQAATDDAPQKDDPEA